FFFLIRTSPPPIYTLSLHDALPIFAIGQWATFAPVWARTSISAGSSQHPWAAITSFPRKPMLSRYFAGRRPVSTKQSSTSRFVRSEEHTSELQSPCNLVCRLLLEKK